MFCGSSAEGDERENSGDLWFSALKPRNSASVCHPALSLRKKTDSQAFGGLPCCRPAAPPSPLTRVPSLSLLLPSQPMGRTAPTLRTSSTPATLLLQPRYRSAQTSMLTRSETASLKSASCALGFMHTNRRPKPSAPKAPWLGVPFALLSRLGPLPRSSRRRRPKKKRSPAPGESPVFLKMG